MERKNQRRKKAVVNGVSCQHDDRHRKALPFGNPRRATLPFLILRQQDSVFLVYLPDGQPSGFLVALAHHYDNFMSKPKHRSALFVLSFLR